MSLGESSPVLAPLLCPPLFHPKITTSAAKQQRQSGPGPSLHKRRPTTSPVGFQLALGGALWAEGALDRCVGGPFEWAQIGRERARTDGRASAGAGSNFIAGKKKEQGIVGDHVGVVGSVCWSWKRLRARAGEVKNSCRFFGSDLPSGPGATGTTRTHLPASTPMAV